MSRPLRLAVIQARTTRDIDANVAWTVKQVREAARQGARYVQTPENTNCLELDKTRLMSLLDTEADCRVLAQFRDAAREAGVWLHVGSMTFKVDGGKIANRALMIAPDGTVTARYDKMHMFDVDLANGESYRESHTYEPGQRAVLVETEFANVGLSICYDIRFPHLYRTLAKAGAEIITAPAAFTRQTGKAHWHVLQRARAIETGCFMVSAAQGGTHDSGRETYGHSIVISPWGEVLAEADDTPETLVVDIDLDAVATARTSVPALSHDKEFSLDVVKASTGTVDRLAGAAE